MKFVFTAPITVSESEKQTFIVGCLMSEGLSRNKNLYTFESLSSIAESAISKPIYFGTTTKFKDGLIIHGKHDLSKPSIGRIIKTWFDKKLKKVFFKALITDKTIPIEEGFGVSIMGKARKATFLKDAFGHLITKISEVFIESVQLFNPNIKRGVESATVHKVVEESFSFVSTHYRLLTIAELIAIAESELNE